MSVFRFLLFLFALNALISCDQTENHEALDAEEVAPIPEMVYGINIDSLTVKRDQVRRNDFLADILLRNGVDYNVIDQIARSTKDVFDVRKIRRGNNYAIIQKNDSMAEPLFFVYEVDNTDFIVYSLKDSIYAYRDVKAVETKLEHANGVIESSLWNAMVDKGTDANLANELSEIFAWAIDFFGIQKGDAYEVIYERNYVEGKPISLGKVLAATFTHYGKTYKAYYFAADSLKGDYYDEVGNSLRRTFLKAPLRFNRISSRFSYSRLHPILKIRRPHLGVDYAAPKGTPVVSVGDGLVTKATWSGGAGRMVKIKHNGTYTTAYLHLSKYGPGIKQGVRVKQGQVIGYVGSSGLSTGPHLDFRFYRNGQAVDPLKVQSPPAKPVDSLLMDAYLKQMKHWSEELEKYQNILQPADTLLQAEI